MKAEEVVEVFEEFDLRRKKIFLFTGEDGRKFRRILLEKDNLNSNDVAYLKELVIILRKHGFDIPADYLEKWLEKQLCEHSATR